MRGKGELFEGGAGSCEVLSMASCCCVHGEGVREKAPGKQGDRDALTSVSSVQRPIVTAGILPLEKHHKIMTAITIKYVGFLDVPGLII